MGKKRPKSSKPLPSKRIKSKDLPVEFNNQPHLEIGPRQDIKQDSCEGVAYEIEDPSFGVLKVRNTANAWWQGRRKVELMIDAFKLDCTVLEMCYYAGISESQYKYFKQIHPDFSTILEVIRQYPVFKARECVVRGLSKNYDNAMRYLERKCKMEFSPRQEHSGPDGEALFPVNLDKAKKAAQNQIKAIDAREKAVADLEKGKR